MSNQKQYGEISLRDAPSMLSVLGSLPFVILYRLITSFWSKGQKHKTWQRVLVDAMSGHVCRMSTPQVQALVGSSDDVYNAFVKGAKLPSTIETLGDGTRIAWIGPKRTDRVALYLHGGGYTMFAPAYGLPFFHFVQQQLSERGTEVGIAVLLYTLHPDGKFPTPLRETTTAVAHLISSGIAPKNLTLVGDSAGGAIILQFFSHLLHRHPSVNPFSFPEGTKMGGSLLMSPWVSIVGTDSGNSFDECNDTDVVDMSVLNRWGTAMLQGIPEEQRVYMEAVYAPDGWFSGVEGLVENVMISAGGYECARNSTVNFYERKFKPHHPDSLFVLHDKGVHVDPFYDFAFGTPKDIGELTPRIIDWLDGVYKTD